MNYFLHNNTELHVNKFPNIEHSSADNQIIPQIQSYLKYVVNRKESLHNLATLNGYIQKEKPKKEKTISKPEKRNRSPLKANTTSLSFLPPKIPQRHIKKLKTVNVSLTNKLTNSLGKNISTDSIFSFKSTVVKKAILHHNPSKLRNLMQSLSFVEKESMKNSEMIHNELKTMTKKTFSLRPQNFRSRSNSVDDLLFLTGINNKTMNVGHNNNSVKSMENISEDTESCMPLMTSKFITNELNGKKILEQTRQISRCSAADSYKNRKYLGRRMGYGVVDIDEDSILVERKMNVTKQYQAPKWVKETVVKQIESMKKIGDISDKVHKRYSIFMKQMCQRKEM